MPTEFPNKEFSQVLDHNKIKHAQAGRMKSRREGRIPQTFQIELSDPTKADAIISNKITYPQTGIIIKVEEFRALISVQQCYNCQNFGHSAKNCQTKVKCVVCGEGHSHKGCPNREKSNQNVLIAKDHMLQTIKSVRLIKNRYSVNMWWNGLPYYKSINNVSRQFSNMAPFRT